MPLPDKSDPNCLGKTIKAETKAGKSKKQATAIGMSHCGKSKKDKKNEVTESDIENLLTSIDKDLTELYDAQSFLWSLKNIYKQGKFSDKFKKIKEKVSKDLDKIDDMNLEDALFTIEELLTKEKKWIDRVINNGNNK